MHSSTQTSLGHRVGSALRAVANSKQVTVSDLAVRPGWDVDATAATLMDPDLTVDEADEIAHSLGTDLADVLWGADL